MSESHDPRLGIWLRRGRAQLGLTQDQLAERAGCAVQTIRAFERDARRPSRAMVERLAQALELPADQRALFARVARGQAPEPAAPAAPLRLQPIPPPAPVGLIGRGDERGELLRRLRAPGQRLITLIGPGGIGKTSLALQAAADVLSAQPPLFPDGVAMALLAPVGAAADVPLAIAEALGLPTDGTRPHAAQLDDALRGRALLLVLDNLEHLLGPGDAVALDELLGRLLSVAPELRVLATSRERLRLRGEHVVELGGLALPAGHGGAQIERSEAVQLFVERARRVAPSFTLSAANQQQVAQICQRLEGMPLALELAATWVRALAPGEILDEIGRALDFLAHADHALPARHRSIRAALDHSWALLSDAERRALARLSVFQGGCDRAGAEAVCGSDGAPLLPTLLALIDKSLVQRGEAAGAARYSLHELVRQYAAARLAASPSEHADAVARHTAHYASLLGRMVAGNTGALSRPDRIALGREIDNLRAAWLSAAEAGDTATLAGMTRGFWVLYEANTWLLDGAALFGQAADALGASAPAAGVRGYLMVLQAIFLARAGQLDRAARLSEQGIAIVEAAGPSALSADLAFNAGMLALNRGQLAHASALLARAAGAAGAAGDHFIQLWATLFVGWTARFRGDYDAAEAAYHACQAASHEHGFARGEATALAYLGDLARVTGRLAEAAAPLSASLRIASAANDRWALSLTLGILGGLALAQNEFDEARYLLAESLATVRELGGEPWLLGGLLCAQGQLACDRGLLAEAQRCYAEVARLVRAGTVILLGELVYGLARVYERAGAPASALALLDALDEVPAEHWVSRLAAGTRQGIVAAAGAGSLAAERPRDRPLLEWLAELCERPLAPAASQHASPLPAPEGALRLPDTGEALSAREVEVLRLLIAGASNQQIADTLIMSRFTAKNHVASILQKLAVGTRAQAAVRGRALGLEPLPLRP
jgi:predicted ATPase/DNA-binding CsgD family transcriptional regulator/DNA-binding XRE family transcriptional regulator